MKKLFIILLTVTLFLTLFGCAGKPNSSTDNSAVIETNSLLENTDNADPTLETTTSETSETVDTTGNTSATKPPQNNTSDVKTTQSTAATPKTSAPPVSVSLSLDKTSIALEVGQTAIIKATVSPSGTAITWTSGDDNIATVNGGTVTGRNTGTTAIIVKAGDKEQRCTVIVKQATVAFNPQPYADYAYSYGRQIGLIPDESLLGLSWNAWINLYGTLSEAQMKKNIEDGLKALKDENHIYFKVYLEKQNESSWRLYLYYG